MRENLSKSQEMILVTNDVAKYCCLSKVCQRMARKGLKVVLMSIPIMGLPFMIGPLLRTSTGKQ